MTTIKKIALILSASNFERQKCIIQSVHKKLKSMGGYALYVFTCYGLFTSPNEYDYGEASIYRLLEQQHFDGCILDGNLIGNDDMLNNFAKILREENIPCVSINAKLEGHPVLTADNYSTTYTLMEHLIETHHCTKINIAADRSNNAFSQQIFAAYKDVLEKYNLPYNPNRIICQTVNLSNGKLLYDIFKDCAIDDADATLCVHDVFAIGLCTALKEHGKKVPDDMILCSLARSTNSMLFRPDITGIDRMDEEAAQNACILLERLIYNKFVPSDNYYLGEVNYGRSCGCKEIEYGSDISDERHCDLIISKIESGKQISSMMQYNDELEKVSSLDELGHNIAKLFEGVNCGEYFCCFNKKTMEYITGQTNKVFTNLLRPFDDNMLILTGHSKRSGTLKNHVFPLSELIPVEPEADDIFIFLPIHQKTHIFGYMIFINEYIPIDIYNYRICHDSLGSSIENLHRILTLKHTIEELDVLHMQDALTGLYNRFALKRFQKDFTSGNEFTVVMIDMDGLKIINDTYGHLSGNHAISIVASVIKAYGENNDLVMRYGGDEFMICSRNTDSDFWESQKEQINQQLCDYVKNQHLPYKLGASLGYCVSTIVAPLSFEVCCEQADRLMYEHKKLRKVQRTS